MTKAQVKIRPSRKTPTTTTDTLAKTMLGSAIIMLDNAIAELAFFVGKRPPGYTAFADETRVRFQEEWSQLVRLRDRLLHIHKRGW